jgi:hypothetical protein
MLIHRIETYIPGIDPVPGEIHSYVRSTGATLEGADKSISKSKDKAQDAPRPARGDLGSVPPPADTRADLAVSLPTCKVPALLVSNRGPEEGRSSRLVRVST